MANNKYLDTLFMVCITSFVVITMPMSSVVISDYAATKTYARGMCNGSTLTNYTVFGEFFFHGRVNVNATVNDTQYAGYLYYPPIKHWQLGAMASEDIDDWYYALNKTGEFRCFVNLSDPSYPMVNEWIEVFGYCIMLTICVFIALGCTCLITRKKPYTTYTSIPNDFPPPPYTPKSEITVSL
jgi:hypothetical protein